MRFETLNQWLVNDLIVALPQETSILHSAAGQRISAIAPISEASSDTLSFSNFPLKRTLEKFNLPKGATIVVKESAEEPPASNLYNVITSPNPRRWFIQATRLMFGDPERAHTGVHNLSHIADGVKLGKNISIGPFVSIDAGCEIKDGVTLKAGVHITSQSVIGENTLIRSNSVIGVPGQAVERDKESKQILLPHLGRVVIGKNTIIGALSVIVGGSLEDTVIGEACMIGNHVNIGHNCKIGPNCFIAPQTVIAGSCRIGQRCWIAPGVKILNKMKIGDNAMLGLGAVVMKPVPASGYVVGNPATPVRKINKYNR